MKKDNTSPDTLAQIRDRKNEFGEDLLILTHHYQRSSIVDLGDFKGDSFDLSRKAANSNASRIVFSAYILWPKARAFYVTSARQCRYRMRRPDAGCPIWPTM